MPHYNIHTFRRFGKTISGQLSQFVKDEAVPMRKLACLLPLLLCSLPALAAELDGRPSLAQVLGKGGPVMVPLYALSVVSFCVVFYYLFTLRLESLAPMPLIQRAEQALAAKDFELLDELCAEDGSMAAKIIGAGMGVARRSKRFVMARAAIEDEGARQASLLWQKIQYLQDIAVVAPMLGLLGTVTGMINSFIGLQTESVVPKQTMVTAGIAEALVTTAAGLVLGIVVMVVYSYFRGHVTRLIAGLESRCDRVLLAIGDAE